ncbi:peptide deformylase [Patescibacteria group bacterium]|nr:peptide deformylase [Patescibacteria group bacterium]
MAILSILQDGDPVLRKQALPVPPELFGTEELSRLIENMAETLEVQPDGVALAAPQIGISYRMFVVRYDRTLPPPPDGSQEPEPLPSLGIFINPTFIKSSRRRVEMDEGCLSVRSIFGTTLRHERATLRAQDDQGKFFERGGGGLLAQIFQHETDHLDGILFIDHAHHLVRIKKKDLNKESEEEIVPLL